jgi:chemotaxis signal transduction protein
MSDQDLFAPIAPPAPAAHGIVLCEFDGLTVAVPQEDVLTIEHGSQLAAPLSGEKVMGWFESDRGPWPVYALTRRLELLEEAGLQRAFLVFLKTELAPIGILCESVRIVGKSEELKTRPLPEPLRRHAPLGTGIAPLPNGRIALAFGAGVFCAYLKTLDTDDFNGDTVVKQNIGAWRRAVESESMAAVRDESPTKSPESVRAWLLDWSLQPLALALCEVIEVVDAPKIHVLPFGPSWCRAVLVWRDQFLALAAKRIDVEYMHVVVTAYQQQEGEPLNYAAFAIDRTPRQITVNDGCDCEPPEGVFKKLNLRASFQFENRTIVVPELVTLFAHESVHA